MSKKTQRKVDSFGVSLRCARERLEYSREQIAGRANISPRYIAAIENDNRKPSLEVLVRIVEAMGVSYDEVLKPPSAENSEIADRVSRLIPQCTRRDQELVLTLIDQMLNNRHQDEK